jgi:L-ascorbate metabolism protein UlaG (beta-lactamase superfamily)
MRILKADDYQTWFIEENNFSILVDPWLDKKLKFIHYDNCNPNLYKHSDF